MYLILRANCITSNNKFTHHSRDDSSDLFTGDSVLNEGVATGENDSS